MSEVIRRLAGERNFVEHMMRSQLLESCNEVSLAEPGNTDQLIEAETRTKHRCRIGNWSCAFTQSIDTRFDRVAHRGRKIERLDVPARPAPILQFQGTGFYEPLERLGDEERISPGRVIQQPDELSRSACINSKLALYYLGDGIMRKRADAHPSSGAYSGKRLFDSADTCVSFPLRVVVRLSLIHISEPT